MSSGEQSERSVCLNCILCITVHKRIGSVWLAGRNCLVVGPNDTLYLFPIDQIVDKLIFVGQLTKDVDQIGTGS